MVYSIYSFRYNDMLLEASISDGSIHLPVLGDSRFKLQNEALKMILDCMATTGAMVSFETLELEAIKRRQAARRKELMSDITMAEKEFGKASPQANAARRVALQEMMMHLDMLEAAGESEEEK